MFNGYENNGTLGPKNKLYFLWAHIFQTVEFNIFSILIWRWFMTQVFLSEIHHTAENYCCKSERSHNHVHRVYLSSVVEKHTHFPDTLIHLAVIENQTCNAALVFVRPQRKKTHFNCSSCHAETTNAKTRRSGCSTDGTSDTSDTSI